jgi:hypothetical protein
VRSVSDLVIDGIGGSEAGEIDVDGMTRARMVILLGVLVPVPVRC